MIPKKDDVNNPSKNIDIVSNYDDVSNNFKENNGNSCVNSYNEIKQTKKEILTLIKEKIKVVIFDMDGVLRIGNDIIDGANNIIPLLKEKLKINSIILTNECRYTNQYLRINLKKIGVNIEENTKIQTASNNISDFLKKKIKKTNKKVELVYVGEEGLEYTINKLTKYDNCIVHKINSKHEVEKDSLFYLVIGTVNNITIEMLENIIKWSKFNPKVLLTCEDKTDPASKCDFSLGLPCHILHLLEHNIKLDGYSLGKPNPLLKSNILKLIRNNFNKKINQDEILFIGDTLCTDIRFAVESEFNSLLVLSGNTNKEILNKSNNIITPDYVLNSVKDLFEIIENI
jgi:HAD superfamily hydrolase (TIGR01450 family)